jgi:uncharacterized protein (TIGR00730 family)
MNVFKQTVQIIADAFSSWHCFHYAKQPMVAILGSARFPKNHPYCQKAHQLSYQLAQKGYWILTGGGLGIMEAASQGAFEAKGTALGCYIKNLESANEYLKKSIHFYQIKTREMVMMQHSQAFVIFPGGFGTLSELVNALVFRQNYHKDTPVFLIGSTFWNPLVTYFKTVFLKEYETIDAFDLDTVFITDTVEDILKKLRLGGHQ